MPVFRLQRGLAALAVFGVLTAPALDAQKRATTEESAAGSVEAV